MKAYMVHLFNGDVFLVKANSVEYAREYIFVDGQSIPHNDIEYAIDEDGYIYKWEREEWLKIKAY